MGTQNIADLNVRLNLELNRLDAQISQANAKVARLSKRMESDFAKAARGINTALRTVGGGLAVGSVVAFGKSLLDLGGQITDLSAQAGLGTQAFQTLSLTAVESGVSGEQLAAAFVQMRKHIEEAVQGSTAMTESFQKLGLSADGLKSLAPERQFEFIARAIQNASDKSAAFNAALDILGSKNAPKLTETLQRLGTEGFDKLSEGLKTVRLNDEQLKTLDDAGDKLERMWMFTKLIAAKALIAVVDAPAEIAKNTPGAVGGFSPGELPAFSESDLPAKKPKAAIIDNSSAVGIPIGATANAASEAATKVVKDYNDAVAAAAAAVAQGAADERDWAAALAESARQEAIANAQGEEMVRQFTERNKAMAEGAAVTASVRTPLEEYNAAVSRLTELHNAGAISAKTLDRATIEQGKAFQEATQNAEKYKDVLSEDEESAKKFQQVNAQMWENIADRAGAALADMLLDGEAKFKDFANVVARTIAETALRLAIINPIINGVFGLSGTASALPAITGARASGGPMSAGGTYLVGEEGPELVTPRANSMVTPNHRLGDMSGGGGDTYNIDARGADAGQLVKLERRIEQLNGSIEKRAIGAVADERRRGGGSGRSLGS